MNKKATIIILFLFALVNLEAQYYSTGEDPASIKWHQIKTDNFQIIFPENADSIGNVLANYFEYVYNYASNSLNHNPKPISIIIHNQTIKSNGMVVWTPKRMELYTNPSQDINPNSWLEELALHEFRHVIQIDKLDQGITHILYYLFGENVTGGISAMVPQWLLEEMQFMQKRCCLNLEEAELPSLICD